MREMARVYPRACGGTTAPGIVVSYDPGLSPRVRGNHGEGLRGITRNRSIPARAGEPDMLLGNANHHWVYPRACGGTPRSILRQRIVPGLSPRVRGNRIPSSGPQKGNGSIPARAGEPPPCSATTRRFRVYPRACGGTLRYGMGLCSAGGLSPRVRGNQSIPPARLVGGLSPRVRGNPGHRHSRRAQSGSIHARGGEPAPGGAVVAVIGVYPRACGGTKTWGGGQRPIRGLSPRVRGNLSHPLWPPRYHGSIPARAGEPRGRVSRTRFPWTQNWLNRSVQGGPEHDR